MTPTTLLAAGFAAWAVLILWGDRSARRRLERLLEVPAPMHAPSVNTAPPLDPTWTRVACWAGAAGAIVLVPNVAGLVIAVLLVVAGPSALARFESSSSRRNRQRAESELPLALDLFAACLDSGASFVAAAHAVADAVDGPLAHSLHDVAVRLELGADPVTVWRALGPGPRVNRVGLALARAVESGAASAGVLASMADDQRSMRRRAGEAAARRVAVRVAAPLGLCFLPAFVLLAVVPAVLGALAPVVRS